MKASWKKFLAGVAAVAMTVGGFALGAGAAMAAIGKGSSDDNPLEKTTTDTTARIAVRDDFYYYESHADRYKAYLVAAYDMDNVKPAASDANYLDIETLKYTQGDLSDATLKTALETAGADSSTLTDTDAIYSALKTVATQSPDAPYGYTDTKNPGTAVAAERKFADALGSALDAMGSTELDSLTSTKITPVEQGTDKLTDENGTAVPKTGLYLVWDTMKDTTGTTEMSTRSVPMLVSSTLYKAPNTVYPGLWLSDGNHTNVNGIIDVKNTYGDVLKQVVKKDGITPNLNPSYSIGDTVTFQLQTNIPNYAGYTKNTDTTKSDARKLLVTDTFELNANSKIPFSDPEVTSVKLYREKRVNDDTFLNEELKNGALTPDADYTAKPTMASDNKTVNGMEIDLAKLVNGSGTTEAGVAWKTDDYVVITLTATLNKDAFVTNKAGTETEGIDPNGNANSVKVDFSDHTAAGHHEVVGPTVNVYSFKFNLVKQYRKDNTPLRNAQFTVKRSSDGKYLTLSDGAWGIVDNEPTADTAYPTKASPDENMLNTLNGKGVFLTDGNGKIVFNGLEEGTYTVHEIKAPQGYFQNALPSFDVTIKPTPYTPDGSNGSQAMFDADEDAVSGDHILTQLEYTYGKSNANGLVTATDGSVTDASDTSSVTVDNVKSITELPKTGAAGIAFFSVIGVAIVALAGVFAVRARKAAKMA